MVTYSVRRGLMSGISLVNRKLSSVQKTGHVSFSDLSVPRVSGSSTAYQLGRRGMVQLTGRDTVDLLQGLVTSNVTELSNTTSTAQYSMMLNVQGRVLYDLILYNNSTAMEVCFLIECDDTVKEDFMKTVKRYKIRKKVDVSDVSSEYQVYSIPSGLDPTQTITSTPMGNRDVAHVPANAKFCLPDPRVPCFGQRVIFRRGEESLPCVDQDEAGYRALRYRWGIPEGPNDLPPGNCLPLESNLAFMNGVSFTKGCYIGQELTARTHHTGVIRKRLVPLVFDRPPQPIAEDSQISTEKGKNAGKVRGVVGIHGLGLLRLQYQGEPLSVNSTDGHKVALSSYEPGWWPADRSS
ncbi:hypothetical protein BaRGS_00029866 [Batillaria attramentaria]|uniref:CAF17 C-terminal domain-containing protein n=1 Tax=Batillaria attramentaria TaxID=370345 RepID=A0ABD0JWA3_9CAEN